MSFVNDQTICEIEEYEGIRYIVRRSVEGGLTHTPINELSKGDEDLIDYVQACCWKLPLKITPNFDIEGHHIDQDMMEGPDSIEGWINSISNRIRWILDKNLYFKDDRYPAIVTNFILNSYFPNVFEYAPRIILTGSTVCGKTRLQDIIGELAYHGYTTIKPTFAILIRLINNYRITPIIDEIQRLKGHDKEDLEDIYLSGNKKGKTISRVNMNTLKVQTYEIYAPLIVSKKTGAFLDDDIENRAFVINMVANRNKKIIPIVDTEELANIRTELYSLQALYKMFPERFRFKELFTESIRLLTETDENGNLLCFDRSGEGNSALLGRSLDLATTYYTLSRLTGTESEILSNLTENQICNAERMKDTLEGRVFRALLSKIQATAYSNALYQFDRIIENVTTKDIQEEYNDQLQDGGNLRTNLDSISCNKVTRTLHDIGFTIGPTTGNRSSIRYTPDLDDIFNNCLERYGSEEDQKVIYNLQKRGISV